MKKKNSSEKNYCKENIKLHVVHIKSNKKYISHDTKISALKLPGMCTSIWIKVKPS